MAGFHLTWIKSIAVLPCGQATPALIEQLILNQDKRFLYSLLRFSKHRCRTSRSAYPISMSLNSTTSLYHF